MLTMCPTLLTFQEYFCSTLISIPYRLLLQKEGYTSQEALTSVLLPLPLLPPPPNSPVRFKKSGLVCIRQCLIVKIIWLGLRRKVLTFKKEDFLLLRQWGGGWVVKDLKLKSKKDKGIMKTCMKEVP